MYFPSASNRNSFSAFEEISIPIRLHNPKVLKKISNCSMEAKVRGIYADPYSLQGESTYEVDGLVYRTRECLVLSFQPQYEGPHKARIYCDGEDFGPCIQFTVNADGKAVVEGERRSSQLYRTLGELGAVGVHTGYGVWRGTHLGGHGWLCRPLAVRVVCMFVVR